MHTKAVTLTGLILVTFSVLLGVAISSLSDFSIDTKFLFVVLGIFFISLFNKYTRKVSFIFFIILVFIVGVIRGNIVKLDPPPPIFKIADSVTFIEGVIISDEETKKHNRFTIHTTYIDKEEGEVFLLIYDPFPTSCSRGDEISLPRGRVQLPEDFITESGRLFPYSNHLAKNSIYGIMFAKEDEIVCTPGEVSHGVHDFFAKWRQGILSLIQKVLQEPESSLLAGLLLGVRGVLPDDILHAFRVTGLVHIIVLSGYNVTLVAEAARRVFFWLPRRFNILLGILVVVLFVLLSGAQIAAVRAGIMAGIVLLARFLHREYEGIRALVFASLLMVLIHPAILLFDVSFHLSFLATAGMLLYAPVLDRIFTKVTDRFQLRSIISITVSTQLFLLPYLAYRIGEVSLVGIFANTLVLPLIPIAMLLGVVLLAMAFMSFPFALLLVPLAQIPLTLIIIFAELLSKPSFASVHLPEISVSVLGFLYFILLATILRKYHS